MKIINLITGLFKKKPIVWANKPNSIEMHDGFVVITGEFPENNINIGIQPAPNPTTGELDDHFCIVVDMGGDMERYNPTLEGLDAALADLRSADTDERKFRAVGL